MSFVESLHLSRQSVQDIAIDQMFFPALEGQPAKISVKDGMRAALHDQKKLWATKASIPFLKNDGDFCGCRNVCIDQR